jgi:hypothetical protein
MRRVIAPALLLAVAIVVAVVVLVTLSDSHGPRPVAGPAGSKTLRGIGFSTAYPRAWSVTSRSGPHESAQYKLSSTGAPVNGLGIGSAGTAGITITDVPAHGESHGLAFSEEHAKASSLLGLLVGTPRVASGVARAVPPRSTTLAGLEAAEEAYHYSYEGRQILQVDVVAQHRGRIVLLELDTEPALASSSQAALTLLGNYWRWQ